MDKTVVWIYLLDLHRALERQNDGTEGAVFFLIKEKLEYFGIDA